MAKKNPMGYDEAGKIMGWLAGEKSNDTESEQEQGSSQEEVSSEEEESYKLCKKCSTKISRTAKFCEGCGAKQ